MNIHNQATYRLWQFNAPDHTLFFSAVFHEGATSETITDCYQEIDSRLISSKACIAQERIFCRLSDQTEILASRNAGLSSEVSMILPVLLEGTPVHSAPAAGLLIRAVPQHSAAPVEFENKVTGMAWRTGGTAHISLPLMIFPLFSNSNDAAKGTADVLAQCEQILAGSGFSYRDVYRTWFYLADILSWYDPFNIGRTEKYQAWSLYPNTEETALRLPASTGIGVNNGHNGSGVLSLLASRGQNVVQLSNPGQKDAFKYGSAFSRGALITNAQGGIFELSGTASIDETGATVFLDDTQKQINCTIEKIQTLIRASKFELHHLAGGAAYLKRKEDNPILQRVLVEKGLTDLPLIPMEAEVCRDNLLFEIDGEFVKLD